MVKGVIYMPLSFIVIYFFFLSFLFAPIILYPLITMVMGIKHGPATYGAHNIFLFSERHCSCKYHSKGEYLRNWQMLFSNSLLSNREYYALIHNIYYLLHTEIGQNDALISRRRPKRQQRICADSRQVDITIELGKATCSST